MKKLKYVKLFENFNQTSESKNKPIVEYLETGFDVSYYQDLEPKVKEIITKLKESAEIKKIISDFMKRFQNKSGELDYSDKVYGNTLQQLLGKIYQGSKNLFDFEKEVTMDLTGITPPKLAGKTYGDIMASVINHNLHEITGLTKQQLPVGYANRTDYSIKNERTRF